MKKLFCIVLICGLSLCIFSSCDSTNKNYYKKSALVMDTLVTLSASGADAQKAVDEGFEKLEEIDNMASATKNTSDISKINSASGISYVPVHSEIMKMIKASIKYSELSGGAFDITAGPLINLWGIGTDNERLPSDEEIKATLPLVDYHNIIINEEEGSVMLLKQGMALDLGGIAKGFAADEVRKIYEKYKIQNGLIFLGSSTIYALGKNNEDKPWVIGIANPRDESSNNYLGILKISNESLSTSGDYERYFIKDGKRYHHILDPKTGYPADSGVMSDTIIINNNVSDNSMISDILSTTIFILGEEKGLEFVESLPNVSCEITTTDYKVYTSEGFQTRLEELNKDYQFVNN